MAGKTNRTGRAWTIVPRALLAATALCVANGLVSVAHAQVVYAPGENKTAPIDISDPVPLGSFVELNVAVGSAEQSGVISGTGLFAGINKTGAGALLLSGENTYLGLTQITEGSLIAGTSSAFGNGPVTGPVHMYGGTTLGYLDGVTISSTIGLVDPTAGGVMTLDIASGRATQAGEIQMPIPGSITLAKTGSGTLALTAANLFLSPTVRIDAGTLEIGHAQALGSGSAMEQQALLAMNGGTLLSAVTTTLSNGIVFKDGTTSTVTVAPEEVLTFGPGLGKITLEANSTAIFGSAGSGTIVIDNDLPSPDPTTDVDPSARLIVAGGTLRAGAGSAALNGLTSVAASTTVNAGALLDLNDNNVEVSNLLGAGIVYTGVDPTKGLSLVNGDFAGVISGAGKLTQLAGGSTVLTGTSDYTGGTFIEAGISPAPVGELTLGTLAQAGSIVGAIVNDGTLNFVNSDTSGITSIVTTGYVHFFNSVNAGAMAINPIPAMGVVQFHDSSSAGTATITNDSAVMFGDDSTAGAATITNNVADVAFFGRANASTATITNNAAGAITFGFPLSTDTASAANATITNNAGGFILFAANSTAGNATIVNQAGPPMGGGVTVFTGFSTAGDATITARSGAGVIFFDNSTGGNARLIAELGGTVDFSGTYGPDDDERVSAGSIEGAGEFLLGFNELTVGGNNLSTEVSGLLSDTCGCGPGNGSLVKVGTGTLTLSGANDYSGGTTINQGTIAAAHVDGGGFVDALGFGPVTIGNGALRGTVTGLLDNDLAVSAGASATISAAAGRELTLVAANYSAGAYSVTHIGAAGDTGTVTFAPTGGLLAADAGAALSIDFGTFRAGNAPGAASLAGFAQFSVSGGATFDLNGLANSVTRLSGGGTVTNAAATPATLQAGGTGASVFSGVIQNGTGGTALQKTGAGILTLSGASTYTGPTTVSGGELRVNGTLGATAVTVQTGATLSGIGTIGGAVAIQSGGILAAGQSPGTLTVGSLMLNAGSISRFELSAPGTVGGGNDLVNVTGSLSLGGTLDVNAAASAGYYRLFNYGGPLAGGFGAVNAGAFTSNVLTNIPGQVNLSLLMAGQQLQFWDGGDQAGNGIVDGGAGIWNAASTNWTGAPGQAGINDRWRGSVGVFAGAAGGAVTVAGTHVFDTLQFSSNGYVLSGGGLEVGPATGTLNVDAGISATIASTIAGAGKGLAKAGAGTLLLSGTNTYSGPTMVAAGLLTVNGSIANSAVTVAGGKLGGTGTVGATTVASGGTLSPGNSIGTLNVNGGVSFAAGSTYEVEINAAGGADLVRASGTATLGGGTVSVLAANGTYAAGQRYTILTADGGVSGTFATVTRNLAFLDMALAYDPRNVFLDVARNNVSFCDAAATANQCATGNGAESLGAGNALYDAVVSLSDVAAARAAFDQLSGEIHASAKGMLLDDSRFVREAATDRIRAAFAGVAPAAPVMAYGAGGATLAAADTERFAVWGQAFGAWGSEDGDGNAAGFDHSGGGFLAGGDALVGETWRLGLLAGYSRSSFDVDDRSSTGDSDNIHLGLYGGTQWGRIGLRAGAAYSWSDIETQRSVTFPGFTDRLTADYDAGTAQVFGELGYKVETGGAVIEPFANLAYVNLRTDAFTEQGGAAALASGKTTTDATFTTLGVRAATGFMLGEMQAEARGMLGWRHAFGDVVPSAAFAFAGGTPFAIAGTPIAKDALAVEAGLDLNLSPAATFGISYSGQIGSGSSDHGAKANLTIRF